jgi:CubicO group peptidase (beta-lactamase class C family)
MPLPSFRTFPAPFLRRRRLPALLPRCGLLPARALGLLLACAAAALSGPVVGAHPVQAQLPAFERASPESVGMSSQGLERATRILQEHVDAGDVAGVVAAVLRRGKLVHAEALGFRELEAQDPMPLDALFRVYSMTRPVTSLAVLLLAQEGTLSLEDPVQRWLPAFAGQPVLQGGGSDPSETRPREGDMTLAHLLTHTSGIGSRSSAPYRAAQVHGWELTLEEVVDRVAGVPLFEDPGTRYRYGMHAEILGRVVEVASGEPFEDFLQARVLDPLGMRDARFHVGPGEAHRLAGLYRREGDGPLRPHGMETIPVTGERTLVSAGVGLVASTEDFLRFGQFFLDAGKDRGAGGVAAGAGSVDAGAGGDPLEGSTRPGIYLDPTHLALATTNGVPEALLPLGAGGYWAGSGWSLGGFAVALDPSAYAHPVNPGTFWWDGSAGTRFWIDPGEELVVVVMAQLSPAGGNGFRERFMTGVMEAILEEADPGSGLP